MESPSAGAGPAGAAPTGKYEFTSSENVTVGRTAKWARIWGWIAIVMGALMALLGVLALPAGIVNVIVGGIYIFVGMYFKGAGDSLQSVVDTAGNDVSHLMTALEKLGSAFKITVILMIVGIVLGVLAALVVGGAVASGMAGGM